MGTHIWNLTTIRAAISGNALQQEPDGRWIPCRPVALGGRLRAAWLVLTGKADALVWRVKESPDAE